MRRCSGYVPPPGGDRCNSVCDIMSRGPVSERGGQPGSSHTLGWRRRDRAARRDRVVTRRDRGMRRDRAGRRDVPARRNAPPAPYSGILWRLSCWLFVAMLRSSSGVRRPTWLWSVFMRRALCTSLERRRAFRGCSTFARRGVFGRRGASALLASRPRRLFNRAPLVAHRSWPCMRHRSRTGTRLAFGPRVLRHSAMLPRVAL